jgi:opacity protein-like surface antigen
MRSTKGKSGGAEMKTVLVSVILVALISTSSSSQPAIEGRNNWGILRVQGLMTLPAGNDHAEIYNDCGDGFFDFLNFSASININTSGGVLGSFEYVLKRRYGIELAFNWWRQFVGLSFETEDLTIEGTPNFILPTLGFNYHFLEGSNADLYLGAMATLGIFVTGTGTDIDLNKSFAFGLNLGYDYYLSEKWFIGGTAKYIDFGELEFDLLPPGISGIICDNGLFGLGSLRTLSLSCGAGYRF